jgi:hypothetical protein
MLKNVIIILIILKDAVMSWWSIARGSVANAARAVASRPSVYGAQSVISSKVFSHATSSHSTTSIPQAASLLVSTGSTPHLHPSMDVQLPQKGTGSSSASWLIPAVDRSNLVGSFRRARDHLLSLNPQAGPPESSQPSAHAGSDNIPIREVASFEVEVSRWVSEAPEGENRSRAAEIILSYARREHSELFNEQPFLEYSEDPMLDVELPPLDKFEHAPRAVGVCPKEDRYILDLDGLNLSSLPDRFEELTSIEILSIAQNRFAEMPDSVAKLPQLRELDLRNNFLTLVPSALEKAPQLTHLFLAGNQINQIGEWMIESKLIFCDIFDLEKQRLIFQKAFPKLFAWEEEARTPDEKEGRIKVSDKILDELDKPTGILLLRNYKLTLLPDIFDLLPDIETLDVSDNRLETLPESIKNLKRLQTLYIQKNLFSSLPSVLGDLQQLELIYGKLNPLRNLPSSLKQCASLTIHVDSPDSKETSLMWDELSTNHNLAQALKYITLKGFRAEWKPIDIWHSRGKFFTALKDWNTGQKEKIRQSILCAHDFRETTLSLSIQGLDTFPWIIFDLENLEELHLFFDGKVTYFESILKEVCRSKIQKISWPSHTEPTPLFLEFFEESDRERHHWIRKKASENIACEFFEAVDLRSISETPPAEAMISYTDHGFPAPITHSYQGTAPSTTVINTRALRRLEMIIRHAGSDAIAHRAENDSSGQDQLSLLSILKAAPIFVSVIASMSAAKAPNTEEANAVQSIQRVYRGHLERKKAQRLKEAKRLKEEAERVAEAQKNKKAPMIRSKL